MQPRGYAAFYECLGILMGILFLHGGEPWDAQIREVLTIFPAASGMVACHSFRVKGLSSPESNIERRFLVALKSKTSSAAQPTTARVPLANG